MCFIDAPARPRRPAARLAASPLPALLLILALAGCGAVPLPPFLATPGGEPSGERLPEPTVLPNGKLSPPQAARSWEEFKRQAAHRMVAANPDGTYTGDVPNPLLAIPVLEVELNGDGSIRRIEVLRVPKAGHTETVQMAIEAVRRAAPFGDVHHLPKPWRFTEAFLYDDDKRFKPRTLDE